MTDELPDDDAGHLKGMPTGYVYHAKSIELVKGTVALACGAENGIAGKAKLMIDRGCHYFNITAFQADFLKRDHAITSKRIPIDLGRDGVVLTPLAQETGICAGCSFGEAAFLAWCARYAETGAGPHPIEVSFLAAYMMGRELSITGAGDSGSCPPYIAQGFHDIGAVPVTAGMQDLPPHGPNSQEALCVQMRDQRNPPPISREWIDAGAPYKCRVYSPDDAWSIADCLATRRPVTFGCSYQAREAVVGSNGISSLYALRDGWGRPAGHETFATGFFTLNGRLGYTKRESWWNILFPGSKWPDHRVTIQTDSGPQRLYPGECAIWADEWLACRPESWSVDAPGTRA